jgi:hypothetical protein
LEVQTTPSLEEVTVEQLELQLGAYLPVWVVPAVGNAVVLVRAALVEAAEGREDSHRLHCHHFPYLAVGEVVLVPEQQKAFYVQRPHLLVHSQLFPAMLLFTLFRRQPSARLELAVERL